MHGVLPTEHLHFACRYAWCPTLMPGECVGLTLHLRDPEVISWKTCLQITILGLLSKRHVGFSPGLLSQQR